MKNIFDPKDVASIIERINQLTPDTERQWGTMTPAQMLAHVSVAYEMVYTDKHPKANFLVRFMLKLFVKNTVVGEKPYKRNNPTASAFVIKDDRDFEVEKKRLIGFIRQTQELGASHFDGKENLNFGKLSVKEWNILFFKHLDHHLQQFGI